ncbi:Target of EGR1, member 1 (Nuclear) [Mortierella sp. GBA30]|nr:Target of EGR1, member 1 (Nuclear) [Mortierella sp. GBA30]
MHIAALPLPTYNQVTKHNLAQLQPVIVQLLKEAAFIALDAEFTGLGSNPETTRARDVQDRYQHLCELARSHALVAFGLSIFIRTEQKGKKDNKDTNVQMGGPVEASENERAFRVHNFNFSMLIERDYMVSPRSMLFLAENGLDLNQWIMEGIPYTGGDRLVNEGGRGNPNGIMRSIFKRIMTRQVPVVVHNGFLDLIFLYHSFYADLPPKLATFVADLSDMFPGGLFDTKYISDYITRERSSFLAYLFRKYERDDIRLKLEEKLEVEARPAPSSQRIFSTFDIQPRLALPSAKEPVAAKTKSSGSADVPFCEDYAFHGVCKKNMRCGKSHDLDLILDTEEEQRDSKRRKRQKKNLSAMETKFNDEKQSESETTAANRVPDPGQQERAQQQQQQTEPDTCSLLPPSSSLVNCPAEENAAPSPAVLNPQSTAAPGAGASGAIKTKAAENVVQPGEKFHSAYYDAFMTGTIFAHQLNQHKPDEIEAQARNKIYLIGKSFPLMVEKSAFAKYSPGHERQRS